MHQTAAGAIMPPPKRINHTSGQTGMVENQKHYGANYSNSGANNQYLSFADVRIAAAGRWEGIHRALGIQLTTTSHLKHTPCPGCGGKDRFRLDATYQDTGRWICSGGGDRQMGDGFALLSHVQGWTAGEALKAVADHLGLGKMPDRDRAALRLRADRLAAQMADDAKKKDEMERAYSNMLDAVYELEDSIKYARYIMRTANSVTGGSVVMTPPDDTLTAIKNLITTAIDGFGTYMQKEGAANV